MASPKRTPPTGKTNSALYNVAIENPVITQFADGTDELSGQRLVTLVFAYAQIFDIPFHPRYEGILMVQIRGDFSPAALLIFSHLFEARKGIFSLGVSGTFDESQTLLHVDSLLHTQFFPSASKKALKKTSKSLGAKKVQKIFGPRS